MTDGDIIDELLADARERMTKSVEATRHEFSSVRTGRANPALLDRIDGRLLRNGDAAQTAGDGDGARGPDADDPAL